MIDCGWQLSENNGQHTSAANAYVPTSTEVAVSVLPRPEFSKSTIDRFLSGISRPFGESGCWIWTRSKNARGYGYFYANNLAWKAHRFTYACFVGEIPPGLLVCHRCDTPSCVNPAHLFLGTHADNVRDMVQKNRVSKASRAPARLAASAAAAKRRSELNLELVRISAGIAGKVCGNGLHLLSGDNIRTDNLGCRACKAQRDKERQIRAKRI